MVTRECRQRVEESLRSIVPVDAAAMGAARDRQRRLTKPVGSLGRLESIAERVCGIQRTLKPEVGRRLVVVCAGDHGIAADGVSAYPSAVTAQMVRNFLRGGAAVNALARAAGADVWVVDVGVSTPIDAEGGAARLISRRIRAGTRNMLHEPAMDEDEALQAIAAGIEVVTTAAANDVAIVGLGDMGIGNTTAASAITGALLRQPASAVTGRGTGVPDAVLAHKISVVDRVLARVPQQDASPLSILATVGGLEIAALCGVCIGGAALRRVVVIDGFITTAAALVAVSLCPSIGDYLLAAHRSPEPGHALQLAHLNQRPLLNLEMRLGEGTGAALAIQLIASACAAFNEMATFETAAVSGAVC